MKIAVILTALLISACATVGVEPARKVTINRSADINGQSDGQLLARSKTWIERHLYNKENNVLRDADESTGTIEAEGVIDYPAKGALAEIDRIQYTISFAMTTVIRNSHVNITFDNLLLNIPKYYYQRFRFTQEYYGGYSVPVTEREDVEAAGRGLAEIADRLLAYLRRGKE
jgi:hypothetical protein